MTRELSTAARTGWPTPVPYSTCEVDGTFVVQAMVAPERVMLLAEIPVASGGMAVGTLLGVLVAVGISVAIAVGERVGVAVDKTVAVLIRVGVRVAGGVAVEEDDHVGEWWRSGRGGTADGEGNGRRGRDA